MLVCFHTSHCENTSQYNKQVNQKQISILHLIFHRLTVVYVLLCSLKEGIAPKIRKLCSVKINSVSLNLLYVCMFRTLTAVFFFFSFFFFSFSFFNTWKKNQFLYICSWPFFLRREGRGAFNPSMSLIGWKLLFLGDGMEDWKKELQRKMLGSKLHSCT